MPKRHVLAFIFLLKYFPEVLVKANHGLITMSYDIIASHICGPQRRRHLWVYYLSHTRFDIFTLLPPGTENHSNAIPLSAQILSFPFKYRY